MDVDSGAEVTVWPPELFLEVATVESEESHRGVKNLGPGDTKGVPFSEGFGTCEGGLELPRCPGYVVPGNA